MLLQHTIESAKVTLRVRGPAWKWMEELYAQNKGVIWFAGIVLSSGALLAKLWPF
jgi:hypothetical protein